jgi:hypothetical protein
VYAAYNAGEQRVRDAVDRYGDGWLSHMPQETQDYVPKVKAVRAQLVQQAQQQINARPVPQNIGQPPTPQEQGMVLSAAQNPQGRNVPSYARPDDGTPTFKEVVQLPGGGQALARPGNQQTQGNAPIPGRTQTLAEQESVKRQSAVSEQQQKLDLQNQAAGTGEAQKLGVQNIMKTAEQLQNSSATLSNIEHAKELIPKASSYAGSLGGTKLAMTKFFNNNLGMNINVEGVKSAEELRSSLFLQIMDNLKKMDAAP